MGQSSRWRRPTAADYNIDPNAGLTQQEIDDLLRAQPPIRDVPPAPDSPATFIERSTRSLNPVEYVRGMRDTVTDPVGTASNLAMMPLNLAGQAVDEFQQGNYPKAARKAFDASVPFLGAAAGGMVGGPAGMVAGYLAGTGVGAGVDEVADQAEQGNYWGAAGAGVDTGVQAAMGRGAVQPRPRPSPSNATRAANLEQKVGNIAARTIAPTIGEDRYAWGNEARDIGGRIFQRTTGSSVDAISQQMENLRQRSTGALDATYDLIPPTQRMPTAPVRQGLQAALNKVLVQDARGNWVPPPGKVEYATALQNAIDQLGAMPATLDAGTIRNIRQGWDNLAADVWEPKTNAEWKRIRAEGKAYADARTVLNNETVRAYPSLGPQMQEVSFSLQATDLLRALAETEGARSRIGRRIMSATGGMTAGLVSGGPAAGVVGAVTAPVVEYLVTERLGPGGKIKAARIMANMASELRQNGQTPLALRYADELKMLAQPMGQAGRASQATERRDAADPTPPPALRAQPTAADSRAPGGWFNQVLSQVKTPR